MIKTNEETFMNNLKISRWIGVILCTLLLITGCSNETEETTKLIK